MFLDVAVLYRRPTPSCVAVILTMLISFGSGHQLQAQTYGFANVVPPQFTCGAAVCQPVANGVKLDPGSILLFDAANLASVTYSFNSNVPGIRPQVKLEMSESSCSGVGTWKEAASVADATPEIGFVHQKLGAVCVRLFPTSASPAGITVTSASVRVRTEGEIQSIQMQETIRAQADLILAPFISKVENLGVPETLQRLVTDSTNLVRTLDLLALNAERSGNIVFETNFAAAVGAVNQTANPLSYASFNAIMTKLDSELQSEPVLAAYLDNLEGQLKKPADRIKGILKAGANIATGVMTAAGYGAVANGLKSLVATAFSKNAVASRVLSTVSTSELVTAGDLNDKVKFKELGPILVKAMTGQQNAVVTRVSEGKTMFRDLDSLLNTLSDVNSSVNAMNEQLVAVANMAAANESRFIGDVTDIMKLTGTNCVPDCAVHATNLRGTSAERAATMDAIGGYFARLRARISSGNAAQRAAANEDLSRIEMRLAPIMATTPQNYRLMVETYRSYFESLTHYVKQANNPFGPCNTVNSQGSPACNWEEIAGTARGHLTAIYPSRFNIRYAN